MLFGFNFQGVQPAGSGFELPADENIYPGVVQSATDGTTKTGDPQCKIVVRLDPAAARGDFKVTFSRNYPDAAGKYLPSWLRIYAACGVAPVESMQKAGLQNVDPCMLLPGKQVLVYVGPQITEAEKAAGKKYRETEMVLREEVADKQREINNRRSGGQTMTGGQQGTGFTGGQQGTGFTGGQQGGAVGGFGGQQQGAAPSQGGMAGGFGGQQGGGGMATGGFGGQQGGMAGGFGGQQGGGMTGGNNGATMPSGLGAAMTQATGGFGGAS